MGAELRRLRNPECSQSNASVSSGSDNGPDTDTLRERKRQRDEARKVAVQVAEDILHQICGMEQGLYAAQAKRTCSMKKVENKFTGESIAALKDLLKRMQECPESKKVTKRIEGVKRQICAEAENYSPELKAIDQEIAEIISKIADAKELRESVLEAARSG